jgi:hypothetical protein
VVVDSQQLICFQSSPDPDPPDPHRGCLPESRSGEKNNRKKMDLGKFKRMSF